MICVCAVPCATGFSGCWRNKILISKLLFQASVSEFIKTTSNAFHSILANKNFSFSKQRVWTSFQISLIFFSLNYWYQYVMLQKNSSYFSQPSCQKPQSQSKSYIFRMPLFRASHSDERLLILIWLKSNGKTLSEFSDPGPSLNYSLRTPGSISHFHPQCSCTCEVRVSAGEN